MLKQLHTKYVCNQGERSTMEDDSISGVEFESPHKLLSTAEEFPVEIAGVGELSTRWVGSKGVLSIRKQLVQEGATEQVKTLNAELKLMAQQCTEAFKVSGLMESENTNVRRAIDLCASYLGVPQASKVPKTTSSIATLWKQQVLDESEQSTSKNPSDLASSVLGEKLMDTLTEKNREPPDVCSIVIASVHLV